MAANTVLIYIPTGKCSSQTHRNYQAGIFPVIYLRQHDHLQHLGASGTFGGEYLSVKTQQDPLQRSPFYDDFYACFFIVEQFVHLLFDPDQGTTLYGTRHILCHLFWRYDLTAEQLFYMVNISIKYFVALPVAILFISATNPSEFLPV